MSRLLTLAALAITSTLLSAAIPSNHFKPDRLIVYKQPEGKALNLHLFLPDGWKADDKVKDYWQAISPAHNVSKPVPPTLFMLGTKDNLIPVATATRFEKTVQDADGRCDLKLHEEASHGFFNHPPHLDNTIAEMIEFLRSLGWIK